MTSPVHRNGAAAVDSPSARRRADVIFLALVAFGVVVRVLTARTSWSQPDGDNALTMMMALRAWHGHFNLLWWGSNYGGAPLSWIEAPLVPLFGVRPWVFATVDCALVVLGAWFVRCIGRRMMSESAAAVAGGVFVFFPALWLYWSSRGYLFWVPSIVVALGCDLLALQWFESRARARLIGCGLCAGVGIWLYPLVLPLLIPAVAAAAWALRRDLRRLLVLGVSILVGVAPWLAYFALHGRAALHRQAVVDGPTTAYQKAVARVLPALFLGSEQRFGSIWKFRIVDDAWLTTVGGAIGIGALVTAVYAWRKREPVLCASGISVLLWGPILVAGHVPLETASFRYAAIVVPPILLIVAYWASRIRLLPVVVIAAAVSSTWLIAANTSGFAADARCDGTLTGTSSYLEAHHLTAVWAAYWLSGPLDVCSNQRITASPVAPPRDRVARDTVEAQPRSVFVVYSQAALDREIAAWTKQHHVPAERRMVAGLAVWVLDRRVDPEAMGLDSAF